MNRFLAASSFEVKKHRVQISDYGRSFYVEVEDQVDAEYLERAVRCYSMYDRLVTHVGMIQHELQQIEPVKQPIISEVHK